MNSGGYGVYPGGRPEKVEALLAFPDSILGVDPGHVGVTFLDGLFQLGLLCFLLLLAPLRVPEKLLRSKLQVEEVVVQCLCTAHIVTHRFDY